MTPALRMKLERAQRLPQSENKVALQIVPVQLRAWIADAAGNACRPWYLVCLELYPRGKVVNQQVHASVAERPGAYAMLNFLVDHIIEPPAGEERLRPTHVSFVEDEVTDACKGYLERLKIEVGTLTLADGVDDYVKAFSKKLVEMDRASRGDSAERPGLLSVPGVTPEIAMELLAATVDMYRAAPWKKIKESIALEVLLPCVDDSGYRERYYATVLGSDEKVFGYALVPSLSALRFKYRRAMALQTTGMFGEFSSDEEDSDEGTTSEKSVGKRTAEKSADGALILCAACGKRVGEDISDDGSRYVNRCGGCKRLLYCNEICQKTDWRKRHRNECNTAASDKEYVFTRVEWARMQREVAMLFMDPTALPFDDLDASDEYKFPFIDETSPPLYPLPFVTVQGPLPMNTRMDRPTLAEAMTMTLVSKALAECATRLRKGEVLHLDTGVTMSVAEDLADSLRPEAPSTP